MWPAFGGALAWDRAARAHRSTLISLIFLCACGSGEQHRAERNEELATLSPELVPCPEVISLSANPLTTAVGGQIALSSDALEEVDDRSYSFSWFASSGNFENAASRHTRYECAEAGLQGLTLFVTDGTCVDLRRLEVTCVEPE